MGIGPPFIRFNDVLLRACESSAPKRYQSAEALRAALWRCQQTAGTVAPPDAETGTTASAGSTTPVGSERKLLTVLVVNITRTEWADPETAQAFMRACMDLVGPVLQRFGGMPVQALSDGLVGVFGEPVACEDHARRATQAALGVRQALEARRQQLQTQYGFGFEVRLSLNTGLAITGQTRHGAPPAGDLVDLAAGIVHLADAGQIAMTEATCRAVRDYFVVRALGERRLLARAAPLNLYQVDGSRELRTRLEAGLGAGPDAVRRPGPRTWAVARTAGGGSRGSGPNCPAGGRAGDRQVSVAAGVSAFPWSWRGLLAGGPLDLVWQPDGVSADH